MNGSNERIEPQPVDVIAQFASNGIIRPIRIRVTDEDGQHQDFTIKSYKDLSHQGTRTMPDGVLVTDETYVYECGIEVFGQLKKIRLYFRTDSHGFDWKITI
jgi:hypothetical protein